MDEADRRQLQRLIERLDLFSTGGIALRVLVADVEFLLAALADQGLRAELRPQWEVLEEVYSVTLAMHGGKLDAHAESLVGSAVKTLRALAAARCAV